jgi:hypothetical protein
MRRRGIALRTPQSLPELIAGDHFANCLGNLARCRDLLGGQVQVMFPSALSSIEYVRTDKVRGLAVTTANARQRCRTVRP